MDMPSAPEAGSGRTVILCYDGSPQAAEAIVYAGQLLPRWHAIVVVVWSRVIEEALATAMTPPVADPADANTLARKSAEGFAEDGAEFAAKAGLDAEGMVVEADGPRWYAIERVAEERAAMLVVCGTRHSGMATALPQTLAGALVAHSSRPVLVVPSAKAAADRLREAEQEHASHHARRRAAPGVGDRTGQQASEARTRPKQT
jgi:nucleotide-binding universal stress UspA family protein